jgi:hypothetical protein
VNGTGSGSCPMAGFCIGNSELSDHVTTESVSLFIYLDLNEIYTLCHIQILLITCCFRFELHRK